MWATLDLTDRVPARIFIGTQSGLPLTSRTDAKEYVENLCSLLQKFWREGNFNFDNLSFTYSLLVILTCLVTHL